MDFFMGQALGQPELPAGSPRPDETPEEGIIVVDNDPDGMTRRYLFKSMGGEKSQVLISETPMDMLPQAAPAVPAVPARMHQPNPAVKTAPAVLVGAPTLGETRMVKGSGIEGRKTGQVLGDSRPLQVTGGDVGGLQRLKATPVTEPSASPTVQVQMPVSPRMGEASLRGSALVQTPTTPMGPSGPMLVDDSVVRNSSPMQAMQGQLGGPTSFMDTSIRVMKATEPALGNVPNQKMSMGTLIPLVSGPGISMGQTPAAPAAPPAPEGAPPGTCPGAIEMPDGRIIEPEDGIMLQDLCELMPFLMDSYKTLEDTKAKKGNGQLAPGQSVPIAGQAPSGSSAVPSTSSQFGPAGSVGGGGGFVGSGGGGGGPGPAGPKGNQGVAGPTGFGGIVDTIQKTDGDFIAGPGAFISVPGTSLMFVQGQLGPATFLLNATLGSTSGASGLSQSVQMGLKVDGTDYPLATRLLHTFAGGVGEFLIAQSVMLTLPLAAGPHTVEVILRGLAPGEFGGAGLGTPAGVSATPSQPLDLSVVHN